MDEMNKTPEDQTSEEVKKQDISAPESTVAEEPVAQPPAPKAPIPKLPFIIGGVVAGVAAIAVAVAVIVGGSSHEHSFGEWKTTDVPTCLAAGIEERICECNEKETRTIDALGHTDVVDEAVDATCTATGLTEGKHCSTCDTIIVEQTTVDKIPHTYDNDNDADCNVCGETRVVACTHTETETISGYAATCTATGLTDGTKCKNCDETIVAQETIPMVSHTYDNKYDDECNVCGYKRDTECGHFETEIVSGYAATCTTTGLTDGSKCKSCGEIIVAQETIPVAAHTEENIPEVEATCTHTGLTAGKKCSVCGEILIAQQETPKIAHSYDNIYDEDCNKCGFIRDAECGHFVTETISGYASTCTATGLTEGTKCKKCGETLVAQSVIPMKSHTEVIDSAVAATCTSTGLTEGKHCSVCSAVLVAQYTVAMKPHTEVTDAAVEATCTATGLTEGKHCSVCSAVLVAQYTVAMKPHTEVIDSAVAATCTATGLTEGKHCSVCSKVLVVQDVIPVSHQYTNQYTYDNDSHWHKCENCSEISEKVKHNLDNNGICNICGVPILPTPGIIYDISTDGTYAEVIGYEGNSKKVKIAEEYNGLPVKNICKDAFHRSDNLITDVIIPDSVLFIGDWAFGANHSLRNVKLSNNLVAIGEYAFSFCNSLVHIEIPDNVTRIGRSSFFLSNAISYNVYENCKYLGNAKNPYLVLIEVESLNYSSYSIHEDTKIIAENALYSCERMRSIDISANVTDIGAYALGKCTSLTSINFEGTVNQWMDVTKSKYWDSSTGDYTVYCTDGEIAKNGTVTYK